MARHKEFDRETAIDAAIAVFREHGYEGTSTGMLVEGMSIGRQSLYDTFGDKWQLYQAALQRYSAAETSEHATALGPGVRELLTEFAQCLIASRQQQPSLVLGLRLFVSLAEANPN